MGSTPNRVSFLSWLGASGRRRRLLRLALLPIGVALVLLPSAFLLVGGWESTPSSGSASGSNLEMVVADSGSAPHLGQAMGSVDANTMQEGLFRLAVALLPTNTPTSTPTSTPPPTSTAVPTLPPTPVPAQPVAPPTDPPLPPSPPASEPTSPPAPPPAAAGCPTAAISGYALALFNAINSERTGNGMPALAASGCVTYVAQIRSSDMASRGYFSHVSPDGSTAFTLMDQYGVPYGWAGENLARNNYPDGETVAVAIRDLMASSGHRANILGANYTSIGVAVANDGAGMKYFTMIFTGPP